MAKKHLLYIIAALTLVYLFLTFYIPKRVMNVDAYANAVQSKVEYDLENLSDRVGLYLNSQRKDDAASFNKLFDRSEYVYFFEQGKLKHWSRADYIPRYFRIEGDYRMIYYPSESGVFIVKRFEANAKDKLEMFVLIPLSRRYPFYNQYLKSTLNQRYFPSGYNVSFSPQLQKDNGDIEVEGVPLFSIKSINLKTTLGNVDRLQLTVGVLLLLFLLIYIFSYALALCKTYHNSGVFLFYSLLILGRFSIYYFQFPAPLPALTIFNPALVNLSWFNISLGDTLINSLFILIGLWFAFKLKLTGHLLLDIDGRRGNVIYAVALIALVVFGLLGVIYQYSSTYTILFNSTIEFDVSRSLFVGLNECLLLLVICINGISFFILIFLLGRWQFNASLKSDLHPAVIIVIAVVALAVVYMLDNELFLISLIYLLSVSIITLYKASFQLEYFTYKTFLAFLCCSFFIAFIHSYAIKKQHISTQLLNKQRFADDLMIENDLLAEYLMTDMPRKMNEDLFVISRMISSSKNKEDVAKRIARVYFNNYFDKYDLKIRLYDSLGQSWSDVEAMNPDYHVLRDKFALDDHATDNPHLYLVETESAIKAHRYFLFVDLKRYDKIIGHIVVELRQKNIIQNNVYPELLVDDKFSDFFSKKDFDYAIYRGDSLTVRYGTFNTKQSLGSELLSNQSVFHKGLIREGYHHLAVKSKVEDKTILISSKSYETLAMLSNFSFLILLFLVVILLVIVLNYRNFKIKSQINLSSKIQLFIFIAFSIPLIALSVIISNSLDASFKAETNFKYLNRASVIANLLVDDFTAYKNDDLTREVIANDVSEIARVAQIDLNLYDVKGGLIATSQPSIYDNNLHSDYAHPLAMFTLKDNTRDYVIFPENIGSLKYQTIYYALKSYESGKTIGMIGLPFFDSKLEVQQQQVTIFNQVIRVFSVVFLLSLLASYYAGKFLTKPLALITERLRGTDFQKENEPINYTSADEIGLLVREYNGMVKNLEKSKSLLAQSEKESAWKEIAKQVAHEIKNPLTPMKLKLQHLKRLVSNEDFESSQLNTPIDGLLQQVETLNDIATSFSAFARMPSPEIEIFDISILLKEVTGLFDQDKGIVLHEVGKPLMISGDKSLMRRILNNLLLNAYQAIPENTTPRINVGLSDKLDTALISIQDNGKGVAEEVRDKIFIPNFTTKSSGSGIGLAVAKRGVELMNGQLWFETSLDIGTTFYISIPKAKTT